MSIKTDYKYVYFILFGKELNNNNEDAWACYAQDDLGGQPLGMVKWHKKWKRYCFFPDEFTFYDIECNKNINHFMGQLKCPETL